eukprot:g29651.t2
MMGDVDLSEHKGKAIRLKGSQGTSYVVSKSGVLKLMLDCCSDVRLHVQASLVTSTVELYKCQRVEVILDQPLGTLQVDECVEPLTVRFAEKDHVGKAYHQNSPGFSIAWGLAGDATPQTVGREGAFQLMTCVTGGQLHTEPVRRGEGEFPLDLGRSTRPEQPEPEAAPASEAKQREAEKQRLAGNEMCLGVLKADSGETDPDSGALLLPVERFAEPGGSESDHTARFYQGVKERQEISVRKVLRLGLEDLPGVMASSRPVAFFDFEALHRARPHYDALFGAEGSDGDGDGAAVETKLKEESRSGCGGPVLRAAALYTLALETAPEMGSVWANRAQCWLKLGDHEKALADAKKCSEVEPSNPKGWFRQGMSRLATGSRPFVSGADDGAEEWLLLTVRSEPSPAHSLL